MKGACLTTCKLGIYKHDAVQGFPIGKREFVKESDARARCDERRLV
jgi:hypothetical protein